MNDKVKNNNIFDAITNGTNTTFEYLQKYDVKDKVKHIFMQYVYQNDKKPVVSEPLFFIRLKFAKFGLLTETGLDQFCRIQRLYHILLRFVNRCKTHRCKIYDVDEDLCLVPFDTLDPRKIIRIKQQGCIYRFNIHDLVNIITTSLTNQYFMIPDPRAPKNPYTNVEFERHHVINIFVRMWELKIKMRPLLYYYFQSNFHIEKFKNRNRLLLCDMSIDSGLTLETIITHDIATDLLNLIQTYSNPFLQIHLHPLFPLKLLYRIFRPYLKLYYKTKLHNCPVLEERLRHGLCCFALFNPQFGRKYVRNDETVAYDDRHLEYGDFTEGAFYELRKMSVFEIIKKYRKNRNNMFCISIEPYKNVKYIYGESIIQYPVLQASSEEEEEEDDDEAIVVAEDDEEDW